MLAQKRTREEVDEERVQVYASALQQVVDKTEAALQTDEDVGNALLSELYSAIAALLRIYTG